MENKPTKTVFIGGEERSFRLDYRACRQARKGKGVVTTTQQIADCVTGAMDFTQVIDTFLFIGLYAENPKLSIAKVDEWLDSGEFDAGPILTAIMEGVRDIFAGSEEKAEPEKKPKAPVKK